MANVYWIHHRDHRDPYTQGYIGISEEVQARLYKHDWDLKKGSHKNPHLLNAYKKYKGYLKQSIIYEGSKEDCLIKEKNFRPEADIGWNVLPGGNIPPNRAGTGPNSGSFKPGHNTWNKGKTFSIESRMKMSASKKGCIPWNKGLKK